jgi:hypothetical protein
VPAVYLQAQPSKFDKFSFNGMRRWTAVIFLPFSIYAEFSADFLVFFVSERIRVGRGAMDRREMDVPLGIVRLCFEFKYYIDKIKQQIK